MKDWRGTRVSVGDTILYAVKQSTYIDINEGIVTHITERESPYRGTAYRISVDWLRSNSSYSDQHRRNKRVVLTAHDTITVIKKADDASG